MFCSGCFTLPNKFYVDRNLEIIWFKATPCALTGMGGSWRHLKTQRITEIWHHYDMMVLKCLWLFEISDVRGQMLSKKNNILVAHSVNDESSLSWSFFFHLLLFMETLYSSVYLVDISLLLSGWCFGFMDILTWT